MSVDVVILAAGKGTRMKSRLPKVLHSLGGQPLVMHSVSAACSISEHLPVLVIGHGADDVRNIIGERARYVVQEEQLGTGHAVMQARSLLEKNASYVIVINSDMPLLRAETLKTLYEIQQANDGPVSMLTFITDTPRGFGRIVRGADNSVLAIVEEAVATPEQKTIKEVNAGAYCYDAEWLWSHLEQIRLSPKGEYYLTDLVEIAVREGKHINTIITGDADEVLGINTRVHLAEAEQALRRRINTELMLSGVTLLDPSATYIEMGVKIGQDTIIYPNTTIRGQTVIGAGCEIGPDSVIIDSTVGDECVIKSSFVEYAVMEAHCEIGPYGHLRKNAYLEQGVHMGNFGEVKNSRLRRGVKMGHFS